MQIWREATLQWLDSGWATIIGGVGPAGAPVDISPYGEATFLHNQYLTLAVEAGVVGALVVIALVTTLLSPRLRRDLSIVIGMLVVCLFGEMLIGTTPGLALGAIAVYAIVFSVDHTRPGEPLAEAELSASGRPAADAIR